MCIIIIVSIIIIVNFCGLCVSCSESRLSGRVGSEPVAAARVGSEPAGLEPTNDASVVSEAAGTARF